MLRSMKQLLASCTILAALTLVLLPAHAQIPALSSSGDAVTTGTHLRISPQYYEPNSVISVELDAYSINTNGATVQWFVDGVEQVNAQDDRTLQLETGALGSTQSVQALITQANGAQIPVTTTVRPVRIDMLVEADTLTPAFYVGRSLPSSGSAVRVTALPFTGSGQNSDQFSYSWKVGEDNINGGAARPEQNSVTFTPAFDTATRVQVTVLDSDGVTIATRTLVIPIVKPELHFYEINPLRGIQTTALDSEHIFQGNEMQVRAEPYYMSRGLYTEDVHITWKLNNRSITNPSNDPQQISLRRQGNQGSFMLEFEIRNLSQLLQGIKDKITLRF